MSDPEAPPVPPVLSSPGRLLPGIVIATRWEAAAVLKAFSFKKIKSGLYRGAIGSRPALLAISGVGAEPAREASYRLFREGARELVSAGFCGALVPELKVGDIVTHRMVSSPVPVKTVRERQALTQRANAVAVDMETQAIIEAGTRRGVPILVCRVVSDRLEDDLTPLFGTDSGFVPWKIAWRLLNPAVWPLANRLRRHSALAKSRLVEALQMQLGSPG